MRRALCLILLALTAWPHAAVIAQTTQTLDQMAFGLEISIRQGGLLERPARPLRLDGLDDPAPAKGRRSEA